MTAIIDADGHFIEPLNLWEKYIDPKYRDRCLSFTQNDQGVYSIEADGFKVPYNVGELLSVLVGYGQKEDGKGLGSFEFEEFFGEDLFDMSDRVQFLDDEGFESQIIFPSIGLITDATVRDPELSAAHCRAYNRWTYEVCAPHKGRLYPMGHVSLRDPQSAVTELEWLAEQGARGAFIGAMPIDGKSFGHPDYDPVWAVAESLDLAINLHLVIHPYYTGHEWHREPTPDFMFVSMSCIQDPRMALTTMVYDGVLERFPKLKVAIVESGSGWVVEWIDRLDYRFSYMGHTSEMKRPASEYFERNIWISADPDERILPYMVELLGDEKFFIGSDYPHAEGFVSPVASARKTLARSTPKQVERILGANAARFYGL